MSQSQNGFCRLALVNLVVKREPLAAIVGQPFPPRRVWHLARKAKHVRWKPVLGGGA